MATKKKTTQKATKKGRVKTLTLKREAVKDLSGSERKKIKGGGGSPGRRIAWHIVPPTGGARPPHLYLRGRSDGH
jgi:hypothetical protein